MNEHRLYRRIIAGQAGVWALPVRAALRATEAVYARGVALRNARYDRIGPRYVLPVPVISVGNLTVGGTGKTPFVIELVRRLERMGHHPAVVSRGYARLRRVDGAPNDEEGVIRKHCPSVVCVCDSDRARAGETAYKKFGADVIILDDGFQHRQLGRSLDIVLVDATCPFGYGHVLPRGLLREPVESLRRAHVVVLTRYDQASTADRIDPAELTRIEARLRRAAADSTFIKCKHRVTSIERLDGTRAARIDPVDGSLKGKRAVLFAGIGHPRSFATTVRSLGVEVVAHRWWPDHHHYRRREIDSLLRTSRFPPYDLLLTTEKDGVKLATLGGSVASRIGVVKVVIDFVDEGDTMLQRVLNQTLRHG